MRHFLFLGRSEGERAQLEVALYGQEAEEDWFNDPAANAAQERLMAETGGPDAMSGAAPPSGF